MNAFDMQIATSSERQAAVPTDRPLTMAVLAMGGQGGGVFCDWVVALAESAGWTVQATSVPGVAQRTGATIYYLEMIASAPGRQPVLALTPTQGEVDIVVAAEWMEAGRSILRGLATPDRTLVIASSHRSLAVGEKEKPGEGEGDPRTVTDALSLAARRVVAFDMERLAQQSGSVISAVLFGALAGSDALPFAREAYEKVIAEGGRSARASLAAFASGFEAARNGASPTLQKDAPPAPRDIPRSRKHPVLAALMAQMQQLPESARAMAAVGVERLCDYQDAGYARDYLDRLEAIAQLDRRSGGGTHDFALTAAAAKYLARAMAYDDVIRVADLKTRASRFARVRVETAAPESALVYPTEYMHPRAQEIIGLMPAAIGARVEQSPKLVRAIDRIFSHGRRINTGTIRGFLPLYVLAGLRFMRRSTLRHRQEMRQISDWIVLVEAYGTRNYALAVELVAAQRLIKGYSDTHARGQSKFARVTGAATLLAPRADGGVWMNRLIRAALKDENGDALDDALKTIATLDDVPAPASA